MKSTQDINGQYAQLCMKLGDLLLNREKLDARVKEIKEEIEILNKALPVAEKVEKQLNLDLQERERAQQSSAEANRAAEAPAQVVQFLDALSSPPAKTVKASKKKKAGDNE